MFGKAFKATFGVGCALIIGVIILIAIGGALGSKAVPSSGPTTAPIGASQAPAIGGAAKTWVAVKEWTGNGVKQTETFTVGNEWRIDWTNNGADYLGVTIKDATGGYVGLVANTTTAGSDTSFQHKGGTFYLEISGTGSWKVGVQDMR
jgi:hypothetical protein